VLLAGEDWQGYFDGFERSAWRLELQSVYTMPQEQGAIARFRAGERLPSSHRSVWMDRVAAYVSSGRTIGRVRISGT
jgi:hypothetical protein